MAKKTVVIVLNFNGLKDTLGCLETLAPQRHAGLEILVLDNGSETDPTDAIHARFGEIPMLRLAENQGWAGGNNVGIAWAREWGADIVCLLNNDTLVPDGGIEQLAETARRIGPCLLHPAIDFAEPGEGAQLDPSRWNSAPIFEGHPGIFVLSYAYGACLVVPMAVFERIGVFDERFFLQLEETDFHHRARAAGIPSLCLPAVRIVHTESSSFGARATPLKTYYIVRNSLLLAQKHDPGIGGFTRAARKLNWLLASLMESRNPPPQSTFKTLCWMGSAEPHAKAARRGVYDFFRRKFGRMLTS
jgi:GT2 family glycosyltransferase